MIYEPLQAGQKIFRLTLLENNGKTWFCRCECGVEKPVSAKHLRARRIKSCGCYWRELLKSESSVVGFKTRHGLADSVIHKTWVRIRNRCFNKNSPDYPYYGGRGITICERWKSFENFYTDMGDKPSPELTIDRIDVNGNYEPSNCRWASRATQSRNRRGCRLIEFNGQQMILSEWAKHLGINRSSLELRLKKWPLEKALTERKKEISE